MVGDAGVTHHRFFSRASPDQSSLKQASLKVVDKLERGRILINREMVCNQLVEWYLGLYKQSYSILRMIRHLAGLINREMVCNQLVEWYLTHKQSSVP